MNEMVPQRVVRAEAAQRLPGIGQHINIHRTLVTPNVKQHHHQTQHCDDPRGMVDHVVEVEGEAEDGDGCVPAVRRRHRMHHQEVARMA